MSENPRWRYRLAAQRLREGAVIAYPTEGVWGLGCDPANEAAVARVLNLKHRSWRKGLILVAATTEQLDWAVDTKNLPRDWPAATTFLVNKSGALPLWISGDSDKVAVRVSSHPVVKSLCAEFGAPIVSTSANPSDRPPALTALRARQYFADGVDFYVPGALGNSDGPSKIIDFDSHAVVRA